AGGRRSEMALHHRFSRQGRRKPPAGNGVIAPARGEEHSDAHFAISPAAAATPHAAWAQLPPALAAPGESAVTTLHAEGGQVYECKAGNDGKLAWAFREPIATLLLDGKTVGRHYAGPTWEYVDGSAVTAKAAANAPGQSAGDIPWLKLEVTGERGSG